MSGDCSHQSQFDAWQRLGAAATLPDALARHLSQCVPCRARAAEVGALRGLFATLPTLEIGQRRLEEMRFLLMAETRSQPRRHPLEEPALQHPRSLDASAHRRWLLQQPFFGYAWASALLVSAATALSSVRYHSNEDRREHEHPAAPQAAEATAPAPSPNTEPPNPLGSSVEAAPPPTHERIAPRRPKPTPSARSKSSRTEAAAAVVLSADARFRRAHALLSQARAREAVSAFDLLADDPAVDAARRADALFWAARAARASGDAAGARSRVERYLAVYPDGWYAARAAALR